MIRKNTKGARTIAEIEEELAQNAGKIPSQQKVVDDAAEGFSAIEDDLATAQDQFAAKESEALNEYGQSTSSARDALRKGALGDVWGRIAAGRRNEAVPSLNAGKAQESFLDPVASRLIEVESIDQATASNPQAVLNLCRGQRTRAQQIPKRE